MRVPGIGCVLLLLLAGLGAAAQDGRGQKNVFFELAGSGGFGSFNLENTFADKEKTDWLWRMGFTAVPGDKNKGLTLIFPVGFTALIGQNTHKLEVGLGQGISITTKGSFYILGTPTVGYRFRNPDKKVFFRITYTPLVSYIIDQQYQHWGGASIGWRLGKKKQDE